MIASLEWEAEDRNCAQAVGLVSFIKKYKFVASLYMLSDILPPLANLSRAFQRKDIDFSIVSPLVQATKATIETLLLTLGEHFHSLPTALLELRSSVICQPSAYEVEQFKKKIYDKYLLVLLDHIAGRFPDVALLEGFRMFDPADVPEELSLLASHRSESLRVLTDHYGHHGIVNAEASQVELKTFNHIVASNVELKGMTSRQLMSHLLKV